MSLLSPDALYIALAPEHVDLLHVRGGLRPRVLARESVAVDAGSSPGAAENWRAALEAIRHAIAGKPLRRTPTIRCGDADQRPQRAPSDPHARRAHPAQSTTPLGAVMKTSLN